VLAVEEAGVVELLDFQQAFGRYITVSDALQVPEVREPFDARGDDDEDVGVFSRCGGEGVCETGRHDDQITALGGLDLLAGQQMGGAVQQVEQLGGVGVLVWLGTVRTVGQADPLGGQRIAGRAESPSGRMVVGAWPITSAAAERTITDSSKPGMISDIRTTPCPGTTGSVNGELWDSAGEQEGGVDEHGHGGGEVDAEGGRLRAAVP